MMRLRNKKEEQLYNMLKDYPVSEEIGLKYFRLDSDKNGEVKSDDYGNVKIVGKQLGFRIQGKDLYNPTFLKWLSIQTNLSDSIRFLIEQEILINGVRNLARFIPQDRDLEEALKEKVQTEIETVSFEMGKSMEVKIEYPHPKESVKEANSEGKQITDNNDDKVQPHQIIINEPENEKVQLKPEPIQKITQLKPEPGISIPSKKGEDNTITPNSPISIASDIKEVVEDDGWDY